MLEKSPARDKAQNLHVKQGQASSTNPIQGHANSPSPIDYSAPGNKNTKEGTNPSTENPNVQGSKRKEHDFSPNTDIKNVTTNGRESQRNDPPTQFPRAKSLSNGTGDENVPRSKLEVYSVARTTTSPQKRLAAFGAQSTAEETPSDKRISTSKNSRPATPSPAPSRKKGDKPGEAKEQEARSGSEISDMIAKAFHGAATNLHAPLRSKHPLPSKPVTERNVQSAPSSSLASSSSNNDRKDATPESRQLRKPKSKAVRGRSKKKLSTTEDGSSSEPEMSSRSKQPVLSAVEPETATGERLITAADASAKPVAGTRVVEIDTKGRSSKENVTSSRTASLGNGGELKPMTVDDVCNVKGTSPKNEQLSRGEFSPGNRGKEQAFTALGSGQGLSFAKVGKKRNKLRPRKSEELLKRQAEAQDSSPILEAKPQETLLEGPESEDDIDDHSMLSLADIPSDEELGIEKIEEIFGRDDVPDSGKLEYMKGIMIKQNQIIARKTQLVNHYLKENEALQEKAEEFDSSILTQEDDISEQQEQIVRLKAAVEEFQRQVQNQESFIKIAEQDKSRLEAELKSSVKSLRRTERDRKALKETLSKMEKDMAQMKNEVDKLIGDKNGCLATISRYESERDMLLCQLRHGPTRLETVRLESELLEKSAELAVANQNFKDLQREFTALRKGEKKEKEKHTPSILSTELRLLGDEKEEDWEPSIDQSGVERNPFAPLSLPVMVPSLFQFGEPTSRGNGGERDETKYQLPNTFLRQTEEAAKGLISIASVNATTHTEIPAGSAISKPKNKVEVLGASTQTETNLELSSHNSTPSNTAEVGVSTQTIAGADADEFEILDASIQTMHEPDVSSEDQTIKLDVLAGSTQKEADVGVHMVTMLEASTQTVVEIDISNSTQTRKVGVFEASTQTYIANGVCDMRDVQVQTDPVTVLRGSGVGQKIRLALIMLAWVVIIHWGHTKDQQLWLEANGLTHSAFVGIRDRSLGPFPWLEQLRYDLIIWLQIDRVLPG
ncbi:hypothetical protein ACJ72_02086 [Emergomyces africanus]|uniref:Uncharacterized protein n=1 Tax=Emergomyces africanus TaxID=1955775 RepID=A0A1B7P3F1_9EURO|nr:hypothetical protein ACJ72_02086 [Emergomyces africanus]